MPNYTFRNNDTSEEYTISLTLAERDQYIQDNNVTQIMTPPQFVSGVGGIKIDDGFRDMLKSMKSRNKGSTINV
jgi:hypothetical protein